MISYCDLANGNWLGRGSGRPQSGAVAGSTGGRTSWEARTGGAGRKAKSATAQAATGTTKDHKARLELIVTSANWGLLSGKEDTPGRIVKPTRGGGAGLDAHQAR